MSRTNRDGDPNITVYIRSIFDYWGKDWHTCELCNKKLKYKGHLHHTKYVGATIYDIKIVCRQCNCKTVNCLLV